jgi:hypothetical protein
MHSQRATRGFVAVLQFFCRDAFSVIGDDLVRLLMRFVDVDVKKWVYAPESREKVLGFVGLRTFRSTSHMNAIFEPCLRQSRSGFLPSLEFFRRNGRMS